MNSASSFHPIESIIRRAGRLLGMLAIILAGLCMGSYWADGMHLRPVAESITERASTDAEKVIALAGWIHRNGKSRENTNYFFMPALRATPVQVLHGGGDCADKSRLLCAMLRQLGISATMLMCFHRETGAATHTVVEAKIKNGRHMVVDPAYDLVFPRDVAGEYWGLLDLRADPAIVERRIAELLPTAPHKSPLHAYNPLSAAYDQASSINWEKNALTRAARSVLATAVGDEVYRWPRPLVLEEPKLAIAMLLVLAGGVMYVISQVLASMLAVAPFSTFEGAVVCGR